MAVDRLRIADVDQASTSRAREVDACMPEGPKGPKHACIADAFDELVQSVGLVGPNRDLCCRAHAEAPAAFAQLVEKALGLGRCPAAFLVRMVKDGDHLKVAAASVPRITTLVESDHSLLAKRLAEEARGSNVYRLP